MLISLSTIHTRSENFQVAVTNALIIFQIFLTEQALRLQSASGWAGIYVRPVDSSEPTVWMNK